MAVAGAHVDTLIILSTFNGSTFLEQQLDSLAMQTHKRIGILVRDDGSSDATLALLDRAKLNGRIEVLPSGTNIGATQSFFELLKYATETTADYIAFCDQDDVWRPDKISRALASLSAVDDRAAMYSSRAEIVGEDLTPLGFTAAPSKIGFGNALVENVCVGCTIVLNRKAVELLVENLPANVFAHDWWCYLVLSCFGEIIFDNEAPIKYRQHGGNAFGVAHGPLDRIQRSLHRFFGPGDGHHWQSTQASIFLKTFGDRIPAVQQQILKDFIDGKLHWRYRWRLAFSNKVWRQKGLDNLVWRALIMMNRY
jgi:glycosyltransferase involved in cell wall biosynthesis